MSFDFIPCMLGISQEHAWCPTRVNETGHYIPNHWGNCNQGCPVSLRPESNGTQVTLFLDLVRHTNKVAL